MKNTSYIYICELCEAMDYLTDELYASLCDLSVAEEREMRADIVTINAEVNRIFSEEGVA